MFVHAVIFVVYSCLLLFIIPKTALAKKSGLSQRLIRWLFLLKITAGMLATWYGYTNAGDLAASYVNSLSETALLKKNPVLFFTSVFSSGYDNYGGMYSTHSFWNDLRYVIPDKMLGILNLFTLSNIYADVLLYNAVIFLCQVAVFRVFISLWPKKKWAVVSGCFLLPSSLFFLSCFNKDSLFFGGIAMVLFVIHQAPRLDAHFFKAKPLLLLTGGMAVMFIIRNFFLMALLPALCCYYVSNYIKLKPVKLFLIVFSALAVVVYCSPAIMKVISDRQNEFLTLGNAKSLVAVPELKPVFRNFIEYLPVSISMVFLRPFIWQSYNTFYFLSALEMLLYQSLFITAIYTLVKNKKRMTVTPLVLFCIFFSITAFLIIGYTIPYLGAVVRYKSAFLPFLITPLLCTLPIDKLLRRFYPVKNS